MAQDKKFAKRKKFSPKNENNKSKTPENKQKPNKKATEKPAKKPEDKSDKPENKGDFKCNNCGGNLVRRWIFSDGKPYTLLQCEDCGTTTKPRDIRYQENGYVWGTRIKKDKSEEKAS